MRRLVVATASLLLVALPCSAQMPATNLQLRLEVHTNALDLIVNGGSASGALFVYQADDLPSLLTSPAVVVETNTALTNGLRFSLTTSGAFSGQSFFTAVHWEGQSVEDFGDRQYLPAEPSPAMILVTAGAPSTLTTDHTFTLDFFVSDPAGRLLDLSGSVAILVFRKSDGELHPDARVSPPTGQLTNGHLRITATVQALSSLDGYVIGLGPDTNGLAPFLEGLFFPASTGLDRFLREAFNLGPAPLANPTRESLFETLEQRRTDNADAGANWEYPLSGNGHAVSGTYGEWRGAITIDEPIGTVHKGLDLAAGVDTEVRASRGGVISRRGKASGAYLVIDHGTGWFSRYLHLDGTSIPATIRVGQPVARGATLATRLHSGAGWAVHFHFETWHDSNRAHWDQPYPGTSKDPLQVNGIFPVALGSSPPRMEEFGLSRRHPGDIPFVKSAPDANSDGAVYVFAKFLDRELKTPRGSGCDPDYHRLGLRSIGFQPEGVTGSEQIRPEDDDAIAFLKPPAAGSHVPPTRRRGFARYDGNHTASANRCNYFRYWWQWDTSGYANERKGPRFLALTVEDHAQSRETLRFTFGPEIKGGTITHLGSQHYQFTNVAHLGTNTPATLGNPSQFVQPDQYKLEILLPDGQLLSDVTWSPPLDGGYTKVFVNHTNEEVYSFTLPSGVSPDGLKLRVTSRMAPDIADEACFCYGPNLVFLPGGTFTMGSKPSETWGHLHPTDEEPETQVTISQGFCLGKYEVTQGEYLDITGVNPSRFTGDLTRPVEQVSWTEAVAYCNALTDRERRAGRLPTGHAYRLPTEAEWEFACRAGITTPFYYGTALRSGMANFDGRYEYQLSGCRDIDGNLSIYGCYNPNGVILQRTTTTRSYAPNAMGLHQMHGNVSEWCQDWYGYQLAGGNVTDPRGPSGGQLRVCRGGHWQAPGYQCRSANRGGNYPSARNLVIGFRVALSRVP